ncbi:MAG: C40 family peptidase, partial [Lachnospiraceae bacterium]|nr:C40 family peptidase [Lachnospiraceae bacterium]
MRKHFVKKAGIAVFAMTMMMTTVAMANPSDNADNTGVNGLTTSATTETPTDGVASVAGISGILDEYYNVVESGAYDKALEVEMSALTDEEIARKAAVLEDYENLGIALVDSYLNVRELPSSNNATSKIIGKMIQNTACEILDEADGWYKIKSGPVTGYVASKYVVTGEEAIEIALEEAKLRAIVTTSGSELRVREEPNTDSKVLEKVSSDERYEVLEILDGWVKIATVTGEGYVSAEYVEVKYALNEAVEFTPPMTSSKRQGIIEYAQRFVGGKYKFGGTSLTKGIDCSAFVQQIFAKYGIELPRTSKTQSNVGRTISWSEIQPGDLIFYGRSGVSGVGHVAIYIGNGKIVHAASERLGITIS